MQYNYPINAEDIDKIHEIMSQRPESGLSFGFTEALGAIAFIVIAIVMSLLVLLFFLDEPVLGCGALLIIVPYFASCLFSIFSTDNIEDEWKKDISAAAKPSLNNEKEYQKFRNSMMRYLETKNIDLVKNCNATPEIIRSYPHGNYPINNIMCTQSPDILSGTVLFVDEDDNAQEFVYNTIINENDDYLEFTMKESEKNEL